MVSASQMRDDSGLKIILETGIQSFETMSFAVRIFVSKNSGFRGSVRFGMVWKPDLKHLTYFFSPQNLYNGPALVSKAPSLIICHLCRHCLSKKLFRCFFFAHPRCKRTFVSVHKGIASPSYF